MTKDVLVSIREMQPEGGREASGNSAGTTAYGCYYRKNDSCYVMFEETAEDGAKTRSRIKFSEDYMELQRKGSINVRMVFDMNAKTQSSYGTPYGNILLGINTKSISLKESEEQIRFLVEYSLEAEEGFLADCRVVVDITPQRGTESAFETGKEKIDT